MVKKEKHFMRRLSGNDKIAENKVTENIIWNFFHISIAIILHFSGKQCFFAF